MYIVLAVIIMLFVATVVTVTFLLLESTDKDPNLIEIMEPTHQMRTDIITMKADIDPELALEVDEQIEKLE